MMQRSTVRCPCCRRSNERAATNEGGGAGLGRYGRLALEPVGDDEWRLDIRTSGRRADQNRLRWVVAMPKDARIGIGERAALIHAAKHFLWSMRVDPPAGRKRSSLASLHERPDSAHADRVDGDRGCAASPTSTRALSIACAFGCAVVPPAMERRGSAQAR
jgi:hypothetical protein